MQNIRLDIEYDGHDFHGWQRQPDGATIQQTIEDCLAAIMKKKVILYGSSRTDSGVHALNQVANFYSDYPVTPERWRLILNNMLPKSIRILSAREMPPTFHSQRNTLSKLYHYRVLNRAYSSALDRRVLFFPRPLDWGKIRECLPYFTGKKDFKSFQGAGSERRTTVRNILSFTVEEEYPSLYCFKIEGTGFLKQMVRTIIGTILEVGEGKRTPESIDEIFQARSRQAAGKTAPASGLCLIHIRYPEE